MSSISNAPRWISPCTASRISFPDMTRYCPIPRALHEKPGRFIDRPHDLAKALPYIYSRRIRVRFRMESYRDRHIPLLRIWQFGSSQMKLDLSDHSIRTKTFEEAQG